MIFLAGITLIVADLLLHCSPVQSSPFSSGVHGTGVVRFQEVWGRSFCRTMEKLVEVVQEYPGEVEHVFSPTCVLLWRCAGCCGDENLECYPTHTRNLTAQLLKIKPGDGEKEYVEMTFMEHQTCECRPRNITLKDERQRLRERGRKRKERQRAKECDTCLPPRRRRAHSMDCLEELAASGIGQGFHGDELMSDGPTREARVSPGWGVFANERSTSCHLTSQRRSRGGLQQAWTMLKGPHGD
ncbi:hypothetical protein SKAU_G00191730 [Synaphobranchus kaupii]|uniref:Platelet-derived growth factor (PDGF) family profile domain-containing protein n=1 Tax=Synaphobranchus kaupii TaxID=118154 RepID=A0A9Q1IWF4_SYNKA|nr:hypothetical protein SKAU_G00191730 [Synaphobranchus kaupii]